jgi:hypothetical protein
VASSYPEKGLPAGGGGDCAADLTFRTGSDHGQSARTEARAELRDRETYYAELRFAVHCQSRSVPVPRAALDDLGQPNRASGKNAQDTEGESWDEMIAHFGDTWT